MARIFNTSGTNYEPFHGLDPQRKNRRIKDSHLILIGKEKVKTRETYVDKVIVGRISRPGLLTYHINLDIDGRQK